MLVVVHIVNVVSDCQLRYSLESGTESLLLVPFMLFSSWNLLAVQVCLDAEALIERTEIVRNKAAGVAVHTGGRAVIVDCDIHRYSL